MTLLIRVPRRALLVTAMLAASACGPFTEKEPEKSRPADETAGKNVEMSAQTDPAPVLERTKGIPEQAEMLWFSGTTGSGAPGPSTYWIDARITVDEAQAQTWRSLCPAGKRQSPEVVPELAEQLPDTDFAECPALAAELAAPGWETRAWIAHQQPLIVLTLVGQG